MTTHRAREPRALRRFRRAVGARPLVLGHRGARRDAPENTLQAFEQAIAQGAAGVELDVRLDGDGRVIVFHDRDLARLTGKRDSRAVEALSASELERVDLGEGAGIPTLAAVLDWAIGGGHLLNVELKRDVLGKRALVWKVAKLLGARPTAKELVLLSSFDPLFVRALAWLVPDVPSAWLVHAKQRVLSAAPGYRKLGAVGVHPELACASDARLRRWHAQGALVNVWTVNEPADALRLARAGVDAIISDVPGTIVRALA